MTHEYIALIPARGGSKGVPRKNLEMVGSETLLERAIRAGMGSARVARCFVSSDDDEILSLAGVHGIVGHRRSDLASADDARASEVVDDLIATHGELTEDARVVYLQPTSPFRTSSHVDKAIELLEVSGAESLVSVVASHQLPEKSLTIGKTGLLALGPRGVDPGKNRQELAESVYPNGALYIFSLRSFRELGDIPVVDSLPFVMGKVESLDIDDPDDLILAKAVADSAGI